MNKSHIQKQVERVEERTICEVHLVTSILHYSANYQEIAADVLAICPPDAFISSKAKAIVTAVAALVRQGKSIGLMAVGQELKSGNSHGCNLADLAEIANSTPAISRNAMFETAHIVAAEWRKDLASVELAQSMSMLQQFAVPTDIAMDGIKASLEILDSDGQEQATDMRSLIEEYSAELESDVRRLRPVPTPFSELNGILRGGLLPTELVVVAARPSVGKSAFMLNVCYQVARQNSGVLVFSLEMARQSLLDRLVANVGNVDLSVFRQGLGRNDYSKVYQALGEIQDLPMHIIDTPRMTVSEIRRRVRVAQRRQNVGLVAIDYLQLITPATREASREREVAEMSRSLKLMAKELRVPVLLLAQLNRKSEEAKRPPITSDLRESGAIEQDADVIMFLHQARPVITNPQEPVQVIVAKGRNSGVGTAYLQFDRHKQRLMGSTEKVFSSAMNEHLAYAATEQIELH